ncbi:MAG: glycosyltransferase family 39 protein [Opitutaceae bacterium]
MKKFFSGLSDSASACLALVERSTSTLPLSRNNAVVAGLIFVLALGFHAWGSTRGWHQVNLIGCEFRQTQTAISALFIQKEHNFSLAYPTPVLGAPWSIPLEFPLYQWTVVGLSNLTGTPLTQAGRSVSLACFYLALPALYLLLASLNLSPSRRLLVLAFVVSCPLYIFYAQSFLIDTMAWMFGLWFLLGFMRAIERRTGAWWLLAIAGGTGAALVKVTTLAFFLLPAAAWAGFILWQERPSRHQGSWRVWWQIIGQALASVLLPCVFAQVWISYTDAIKAQSVGGSFLMSAPERGYIFGIGVRFSWEYWRQHFAILFREIAPWPVLAIATIALLWTRSRWQVALGLVACFFAVQVVFPILYAWHEYYYVANAFALMVAIGLAANGLLDSRLPRLAAWGVVFVLLGLQAWTFGRVHYPILTDAHPRDNVTARLLQLVTQPDDVLVVAGDDWSSIIPFYSERRTLMIRFEVQRDMGFIEKVFTAQKNQPVTALLVQGQQRFNQPLIDLALRHFHLDPRPVLQANEQRLYLTPERRVQVMAHYDDFPPLVGYALAPESALDPARFNEREILWTALPRRQRQYFNSWSVPPRKIFSKYGIAEVNYEGRTRLLASPDTKLWFKVGPGSHEVVAECALSPAAYADEVPAGDRTDGVEFVVSEERPDGTTRMLATLFLNPARVQADRGVHVLKFSGQLAPGADLRIETRPGPNGSYARDWALLGPVSVR